MTHSINSHARRALAAGLVAAAVTALAGCGGSSTAANSPSSARNANYDKSLHEMLPTAIRERGVLTVGTDASYPPMSTFGPDGRTIVGLEPDLGDQLGRALGVRVRFVDQDFTKILEHVAAGNLDLGMSAITDTRKREHRVDFVNYFSAGTAVLVQRGNPAGVTDIQDLCGKPVAVEEGTVQVDLLARAQSNCEQPIRVRRYHTNSDALVQLRTGRAVAVLNDLPPAALLVKEPNTASQYQLASNTQYEPGLYGIAVATDQRNLRDAVQGGIEELVRSGVYSDVLQHWGVTEGALQQVTVNSGS